MPSYDDDLPTPQEELLLKQLMDNSEQEQQIQAIIEVNLFFLFLNFHQMNYSLGIFCFLWIGYS